MWVLSNPKENDRECYIGCDIGDRVYDLLERDKFKKGRVVTSTDGISNDCGDWACFVIQIGGL